MKKILLSILKWAIFSFVIGGAIGYVVGFDGQNIFAVTEMDVVIARPIEQPAFMSEHLERFKSRITSYEGTPLYSIELEGLRNQILNWNWVAGVEVYRQWPDRIRVEVTPKQVVALVLNKNGRLSPVLNDGTVMEPILRSSIPDVPILTGDAFQKQPELMMKTLLTLEQIPHEGRFSKQNIAEVVYHPKKGISYQLIQPNIRVQLGEDQIGIKSARVSQVLEYLKNHNLQARVIDANLTKKVLVRLRKDI
jgi:cell division protein FtsQ